MSSIIIADNKTLSVDNTLTLSGNDGTNLDLAAWDSYTPILTTQFGTITTSTVTATYKQIGKTIAFQMSILLTDVGSAMGALYATLPFQTAANSAFVFVGRENAISGLMCQGHVAGNQTNFFIHFYNNTSVLSNGNLIWLTGVYQSV
jgi:hypothetical protein